MKATTKKEFAILNSLLLVILIVSIPLLKVNVSADFLLSTVDSKTYYNTGLEFFNFDSKGDSIIRPFFYSTFLRFTFELGGSTLVVFLQSIFWMVSVNLVFYASKLLTDKKLVYCGVTAFYALNLSLIGLVFHGLTEVMSAMFLSAIAYVLVKAHKNGFSGLSCAVLIFLCGILVVIKPLFFYPFISLLIFGIIIRFRILVSQPKLMLIILLGISPVLIQMSVMKMKYDKFTVSTISELTLNHYLLAQVYRNVHGEDSVEKSQLVIDSMSKQDRRDFVMSNKMVTFQLYLHNIRENITGNGHSIFYVQKYGNPQVGIVIMKFYNLLMYMIYCCIIILVVLFCLYKFVKRQRLGSWSLIIMAAFAYYITFSSGISFWQNDRLVVFGLPIYLLFYQMFITQVVNKRNYKKVVSN